MHHCLIFNVSAESSVRGYGLYKIAHHLRLNNWDSEVIDFTIDWSLDELKELAKSRISLNTKFIGFGHLFTYWNITLETFCAWLKQTYPHLIFISGSQSFPTYESKYIDHYILGHSENVLIALLKNLFSNGEPIIKTGFSWTDKEVILSNNIHSHYSSGFMTNLEVQYQDRDFICAGEWLTMEFSRGCKFACKFCDFPYLNAKGNYIVAKEDFVTQMKENHDRFGVKNYIVADSTFNETTEKIRTYAEGVDELDFVPFFSGFMRADLLISRPQDKEDLLRMNYLGHAYGIETLNKRAGSTIGKGMDPDKIKTGIYDIHRYFTTHGRKLYSATLTMIAGLPYENKESLENTIRWLEKLPPEVSFQMSPLMITKHNYGAPSAFSLNWEKYGYTDQDSSVKSNLDSSRNIVNWKNDHMTFDEANTIAKNACDRGFDRDRHVDSWAISSFCMQGMTVEKRLSARSDFIDTTEGLSNTHTFIKNYIRQKLNYAT
tara:strand:- start:564 stop:2030 length:1467 start_codon:yes stop_codon:yes gene_type:complete